MTNERVPLLHSVTIDDVELCLASTAFIQHGCHSFKDDATFTGRLCYWACELELAVRSDEDYEADWLPEYVEGNS